MPTAAFLKKPPCYPNLVDPVDHPLALSNTAGFGRVSTRPAIGEECQLSMDLSIDRLFLGQ